MARRVTLPESKLKRRKRVRRMRLAAVLCTALLLILGALAGLSWLPQLRVQSLEIRGAETIATSSVEAFAKAKLEGRVLLVLPRDNIFWYPKKEISAGLLAEYPSLLKADVHAENFETVGITLAERHAKALWCDQDGNCRLMDAGGFVYAPDLSLDTPLLVRYTGEATTTRGYTSQTEPLQYLTPAEFASLSTLVAQLDDNQKDSTIDQVDVDANDDAHAHFSNGFTLIFALKDAGNDVFERFTLALASQPFLDKTIADFEYLDLRFGDKLYYKEKAK